MNFHKSIPVLAYKIQNAKNKQEANEIIRTVLKSFKIQTKQIEYQISNAELDALENSIYNPSLKFKTDFIQKNFLLKKGKSQKFMFLFKHEGLIKIMKKNGASMERIAKYLNSHKTPKKRKANEKKIIINKMDISRYCKERNIKNA